MFVALGCLRTQLVFFPGTPQDASCVGEGWWNHHSLGQPKASNVFSDQDLQVRSLDFNSG